MNDLKGIIEDCNKSDLISDKVIKKIIEIIGQEEWQELHDENNDVCTTMGELIITLKGITELEKEKCELLGIIQGKDKAIKDLEWQLNEVLKDNDYYSDALDKQIEATYKLFEENKELKEKLNFSTQYYQGEKAKEHLTKAKELLTRFVMASVYFNGKETDLIKEAEQFLKECL